MTERSGNDGHETHDMPARVPFRFMLFSTLFIILGAIGIWVLLHSAWQPSGDIRSILVEESASVEGPGLQQNPSHDLEKLNNRMRKRLNSAGWVDRKEGIVHMPIDRAMELLVERGLPEQDRAQSGGEKTQ